MTTYTVITTAFRKAKRSGANFVLSMLQNRLLHVLLVSPGLWISPFVVALPMLSIPMTENNDTAATVSIEAMERGNTQSPDEPLFFSFSTQRKYTSDTNSHPNPSQGKQTADQQNNSTEAEGDQKKHQETFKSLQVKPISGLSFNGWTSHQLISDLDTSPTSLQKYQLKHNKQLIHIKSAEKPIDKQTQNAQDPMAIKPKGAEGAESIATSKRELQHPTKIHRQIEKFSQSLPHDGMKQNIGLGKTRITDSGILSLSLNDDIPIQPTQSIDQDENAMGQFLSRMIKDYLLQWWFWLIIVILFLLLDLMKAKR